MDSSDGINQTLIEMGFESSQIQRAIQETNSSNIEVLITFLENIQNNPNFVNNEAPNQQNDQVSISGLVNSDYVAVLLSLGNSKNVSEKALLFTNNISIDQAQKWIDEHKADPDFEEELLIQQDQKSKMSPEEAAIKALELGRKIRENRKNQEEKDELERERNRLKSGKAMTDIKREVEDMKKIQDAQYLKKQRQQDLKDKEEMLQQLQRDKDERLGKPKNIQKQGDQVKSQIQLSPFEIFSVGIKQIKIAQPPELIPDKAKNSLVLISKILGSYFLQQIENIIKSPQEQKFRKISLTSQVFKTKIEDVYGAKNALDGLGFEVEDGFYQYNGSNVTLLEQAFKVVSQELNGLI